MKKYLQQLHLFLIRRNDAQLILLFVILNILNSLASSAISFFFTQTGIKNHTLTKLNSGNEFLVAVILAPVIETLIFQYALIETIRQKVKPFYACLISASFFALAHIYSPYYVLFAFVSGLLFGYLYLSRKSVLRACLLVLIAHASYNYIVYLGSSLQ